MSFWDMFSDLCAENGKAPTAVAIELGYSNSAATIWKKGARPRPSAIKRIADHFGVPVDYFSEKTEKPAAQGDGLSFAQRALIDYVRGLSDQEAAALLVTLKTLKGAPQSPDQNV